MSAKNRAPRKTRKERRFDRLVAKVDLPDVPGLAKTSVVPTQSLGLRKMSEVLEEYVAPIFEAFGEVPPQALFEKLYYFGAAVWNASTDGAPPEAMGEVLRTFGDDAGAADVLEMVGMLVQRRRERYGDDRRMIGDLKIRWAGGTPHLAVASVVR
jgi:hypothetical protein